MKLNLTAIVITALICMTALEIYALSVGINGSVLATVIGIFGVIVGAVAKTIYNEKKEVKK